MSSLQEEDVDDRVREFVGMSRPKALRNQARQTSAVVERLGLIEHGTGKTERSHGLGDGRAFHLNAANHLILDLHEVACFFPWKAIGGWRT